MGLFSGIAGLLGGGAEDYYGDVKTPDIQSMQVALQQYVDQGIMTPEDAKNVMQDPSAFQQITSDPAFKQAQMKALTGLQDVSDQGGLTAIDKARMNDIANQEGVQQRGAREAVMNNAAERGIGGSGLEMLDQMKANQAGASDQSNRDTQVAADAQNRALNALVESGNMAGSMQSTDFNQQAQKAAAADAINKFNTQNQNQVGMYNTQAQNAAQAENLANKQNIANMNTGVGNQQQLYNKQLPQQNFQNQMQLAGGKSGAFINDENQKRKNINDIEGAAKSIGTGSFFS